MLGKGKKKFYIKQLIITTAIQLRLWLKYEAAQKPVEDAFYTVKIYKTQKYRKHIGHL